MHDIVKAGEVWLHFKGTTYFIIDVAEHTETGEKFVIYRKQYPFNDAERKIYARPLGMFMSEVDREKYPNSLQKYRFEKCNYVPTEVQSTEIKKRYSCSF